MNLLNGSLWCFGPRKLVHSLHFCYFVYSPFAHRTAQPHTPYSMLINNIVRCVLHKKRRNMHTHGKRIIASYSLIWFSFKNRNYVTIDFSGGRCRWRSDFATHTHTTRSDTERCVLLLEHCAFRVCFRIIYFLFSHSICGMRPASQPFIYLFWYLFYFILQICKSINHNSFINVSQRVPWLSSAIWKQKRKDK